MSIGLGIPNAYWDMVKIKLDRSIKEADMSAVSQQQLQDIIRDVGVKPKAYYTLTKRVVMFVQAQLYSMFWINTRLGKLYGNIDINAWAASSDITRRVVACKVLYTFDLISQGDYTLSAQSYRWLKAISISRDTDNRSVLLAENLARAVLAEPSSDFNRWIVLADQ